MFFTAEPPSEVRFDEEKYNKFNNFFNWTYTYRRNADVQRLYGHRMKTFNAVSKGSEVVSSIIEKKTKLAVNK